MPAAGLVSRRIRRHEDALVALGFLSREEYVLGEMDPLGGEFKEAVETMRKECPWYSATWSQEGNLMVTACKTGMTRWHEQAKALEIERQ